MFARGTKGEDGAPSMPRGSTGSAYDGFGALMDAYSDDSDDDSDAETRPQRTNHTQAPPSTQAARPVAGDGERPHTRESWSARAQAVGERPPDSASQNPPTLKLLGLKSQKEGGAPMGGSQAPGGPKYGTQGNALRSNPPQRHDVQEHSMSEYGDNSSRIGSTIDFAGQHGHAGHGSDGFGGHGGDAGPGVADAPTSLPPHLRAPPQAAMRSAPHDSRSALTAQLGLDTPQPDRQPSPTGYGQPQSDYFARSGPPQGHAQEVPLERNTSNESSNYGGPRTPDHAMTRPYPPQGQPSTYPGGPGGSPPGNPFSDRAAPGRSLVSPPHGRPVGGPSAPMNRGPPPGFRAPPGPHVGQAPQNGAPYGGRPGQGPGFSDAQRRPQQDQRRQSIFRRSMAFVTGNGGNGPQESGAPQSRPSREGGNGNRQSIFRRSMAFLSGSKPAPAPAAAPENDDANCPAPRVRGFDEKEAVNRKSQYWGGGGEGREWDTDGGGAKFWRRFSAAQKHAETPGDKMEMASRSMREKVMAQRKAATWLAGLGGILIIAAVVGVVIWRESKSSSTDDHPGSINKGNYGGTDARRRRSPVETALAGAQVENYQRVADEDVWARAKVASPGDDAGAVERAVLPQAAAATPAARSQNNNQSMRRRVRRHSILHRTIGMAERESAGDA